jgi:hypothetical protein
MCIQLELTAVTCATLPLVMTAILTQHGDNLTRGQLVETKAGKGMEDSKGVHRK